MTHPLEQRLEADLAAIRDAIADGRADEARKKISGIPVNFSSGGRLSKEIGDLYLELGFQVMAGRYYYLLEHKSDLMLAACEEFERSLGNNPVLIVGTLGRPHDASAFAKARLKELYRQAGAFRREHGYAVEPARLQDRLALLGCGIVAFVVLFVLVAGITFIAKWFR